MADQCAFCRLIQWGVEGVQWSYLCSLCGQKSTDFVHVEITCLLRTGALLVKSSMLFRGVDLTFTSWPFTLHFALYSRIQIVEKVVAGRLLGWWLAFYGAGDV